MTSSIVHETSIDQFDYVVEYFHYDLIDGPEDYDEFTVYSDGIIQKQIGAPFPLAGRPLSEYTAHDYEQFVRDALASSED